MMRAIIGGLIMALGVILGVYVGGWLMFIEPIFELAAHFDTNTLTGTIVVTNGLKCVFAGMVGSSIIYIGVLVGSWISLNKRKW